MTILYAISPLWMEFQDYKIYDELLGHAGAKPLSGQVVLVDIDEKSLAKLGQWPWPRYRLALLLGLMRQAGVRAVGLDMLLSEPDRTSPVLLERQFKDELGSEVSFAGLPEAFRDYDQALARMLERGPNVISYYFDFGDASIPGEQRAHCDLPPARFTLNSPPGSVSAMQAVIEAPEPSVPCLPCLRPPRRPGFSTCSLIPTTSSAARPWSWASRAPCARVWPWLC